MDYLLIANLITGQKDQRLIEERCSPAERAASGGTGAALPYSVMKSRASCLSRDKDKASSQLQSSTLERAGVSLDTAR
jgi:hypothetical protein